MKRTWIATAAAALTLASALPAFADDHEHDRGNQHAQFSRRAQDNGRAHYAGRVPAGEYRYGGVRPQFSYGGRVFHPGDYWNGHPLVFVNGGWGYYEPHNGVSVFINIPL